MERIYADGRARAIGVSNFQPHHLRRLHEETTVIPAVNQIELHPYLTQEELRAFDAEHGIATEAWSPIAQGGVLDDAVITEIARSYGKTAAQVVLRWHIQLGNIVFPKSTTPSRVRENFEIFDFELTDTEHGPDLRAEQGRADGAEPGRVQLRAREVIRGCSAGAPRRVSDAEPLPRPEPSRGPVAGRRNPSLPVSRSSPSGRRRSAGRAARCPPRSTEAGRCGAVGVPGHAVAMEATALLIGALLLVVGLAIGVLIGRSAPRTDRGSGVGEVAAVAGPGV